MFFECSAIDLLGLMQNVNLALCSKLFARTWARAADLRPLGELRSEPRIFAVHPRKGVNCATHTNHTWRGRGIKEYIEIVALGMVSNRRFEPGNFRSGHSAPERGTAQYPSRRADPRLYLCHGQMRVMCAKQQRMLCRTGRTD